MKNNIQELFDFDENERVISLSDFIIGTDEAGRGPAAGGVWAAAVCFKKDVNKKLLVNLNDSKKLTPKKREELFEIIKENSYYSIKMVDVDEIEKINILNSSLKAMKEAVYDVMEQIKSDKCLTLVDGNRLIKDFIYNQKFIIKGDAKSASISASSILAKVDRDRFMEEIDKKYPHYNWSKNKGYLTSEHIEAIKKYGISEFHRKSFLKNIMYEQQTLCL